MTSVKQESWRLIDDGARNGRENMAIDRAMAFAARQPEARPTLRLYAWKPFAISLGYHQDLHEIDARTCRTDGIDIVYRPTGGRAVLHAEELTYSVIIPRHSRFYHDSIAAIYRMISECLLSAFYLLDIPAQFDRAQKTPKNFHKGDYAALCYASSVQHEIGIQGRKLVGSAQRRIDGVVLQHGSILIGPKHLDITTYLGRSDERWQRAVRRYMESHTIYLNKISPSPVRYEQAASAVISGFHRTLGIELIPLPLNPTETGQVEHILHSENAYLKAGDRGVEESAR